MKKIFKNFCFSSRSAGAGPFPARFGGQAPSPGHACSITRRANAMVTLLGNTRVSGPWALQTCYRERMGSRET